MASFTDDISFNTMVGPGAFITGDLKLEGFTRVDGDIYGNLETTGKLIIGENARVRGSLTAKSVIVIGIVEGGRDFEVTVQFDDFGTKKMFASFAKLQKCE